MVDEPFCCYDCSMTVVHAVETALVAGVILAAIDFVWLTTVAKKFYSDELGSLLLKKAHLAPAVAFYLLYIIGLCYFAIVPALHAGSIGLAALRGSLFGLFCYATYDLTNLSTLRDWSRKVAVVDMIWGTALSGAVATVTYLIMHHFI